MQNIYTTSKICINVNENSKNQTNADKVKHYLLEVFNFTNLKSMFRLSDELFLMCFLTKTSWRN